MPRVPATPCSVASLPCTSCPGARLRAHPALMATATAPTASPGSGMKQGVRTEGDAKSAAAAVSPAAKSFRNWTSQWQPTNYSMLLFRTCNRDTARPNANDDYVAPLFRDRLMPLRGWLNRTFPSLLSMYRAGVEDPAAGLPGVCNFVDARTKWLDCAMKQALAEGYTQVVAIAAGYDTRAYRFSRPGVKFYEVDLPSASKRKQALVAAALLPGSSGARPVYVAANLAEVTLDAALAGTGFDPDKKTLFTCEGLIYYLPQEAVSRLLASVAVVAAPGSRLLLDFLHADAVDGSCHYPGYDACAETVALKGEAFLSGLNPQREALVAHTLPLGWQLHASWTPQQMVAEQLPHEEWDEAVPPILSFYSYMELRRPQPLGPKRPGQPALAAAEGEEASSPTGLIAAAP